tara:strand:+ start:323 stop:898 length:576 start_codon:yes stop_codon:yes gene_type:complete
MGHFITMLVVASCIFVVAKTVTVQRDKSARVRARITVLCTWTIAIIAWPVLWSRAVAEERENPITIVGLLWPLLIIVLDILAMKHHTYEMHAQSNRSMLSMDASAICSLTFALAGIIGANSNKCCNKLFLYAVVGCIAFVMPAPHTHVNAIETVAVEAVQKAVLAYATGLLLTGLILVTSTRHGLLVSEKQ